MDASQSLHLSSREAQTQMFAGSGDKCLTATGGFPRPGSACVWTWGSRESLF